MPSPTPLDPDRCHRALRSRDARFDGRFFTGVRTTGVFCRPVCPAPTPRPAHCTYWPSAAAARAAGFRPCLRCRPEAAPGSPAWLGTAASVGRAMRLIEAGALDHGGDVEALAARLGLGGRHLRRLFERHLGASPGEVARMRRVLFAKQLIDETRLPMTEIAACAGFSSQRRFNACLREVYGRPPTALRRARAGGAQRAGGSPAGAVRAPDAGLWLCFAYRPPFDWSRMLARLAARAMPGVEAVEGQRFGRVVRTRSGLGSILVEHDPARRRLRARIRVPSTQELIAQGGALRRLFDLDADGAEIDRVLAGAAELRSDRARHPGTRVPGAWDGFETAVRAVLGQQVSVRAATTLAGRIAAGWGEPLPRGLALLSGLERAFPAAERLAEASLEAVGLTRGRADAIRALARAVADAPEWLEPGESVEADLARWRALPGVGPWTAACVAMSVLRHPDALPASDLGLRRALAGGTGPPATARAVERALEGCRPYRAYAATRLWAMAAEPAPRARGQRGEVPPPDSRPSA